MSPACIEITDHDGNVLPLSVIYRRVVDIALVRHGSEREVARRLGIGRETLRRRNRISGRSPSRGTDLVQKREN